MADDTENTESQESSDEVREAEPEDILKTLARKLAPPIVDDNTDFEGMVNDSPIVLLANLIIARGVTEKASDIYIHPRRGSIAVRIRRDGIVMDLLSLPIQVWKSLRQRFLVMADLDFVTRKPQVGSIRLIIENQPCTFRLTNVSAEYSYQYGISPDQIAIRPYDSALLVSPPTELGLTPELLTLTDTCLMRPGLTLITGPPGVGCTSTAHFLLRRTERQTRYVALCEDAPSYLPPGDLAIYHNPFQPVPLRETVAALLKQRADLIFLGNLEDTESILVAMEAAERGVPVLAIFQAQDATHALERLRWKGIPADRLHRTLSLIVAQRLVRCLCEHCNTPGETEGTYRVKGCDHCRGTGYRGRFGIFEAISPDNTLGEKTWQPQTPTFRDSANAQIRNGKTTFEEVNRVLSIP